MPASSLFLFDESTNYDYTAFVVLQGNEVWIRRVGESGDGYRVAVAPAQGSGPIYEVASDVDYEVRTKAIAPSGAIRWSEWVADVHVPA